MIFPIPKYYITLKFLEHDLRGCLHPGADLNYAGTVGNQDLGKPVYAIADGEVRFVGFNYPSGWGGMITIYHPQYKVFSCYGHIESPKVRPWQKVKEGQQIAVIGNCRGKWLAHLHFEIRIRPTGSPWTYPCRWSVQKILKYYTDPIKFIQKHLTKKQIQEIKETPRQKALHLLDEIKKKVDEIKKLI